MLISQLAKAAGIHTETVRYYERQGLIKQPDTPIEGYRRYSETILNQIRFIKRAQEMGFTLKEIKNLLKLDEASCHEARYIASQKRTLVRHKLAELRAMEMALNDLINQCDLHQDQIRCPIIDSFTHK